MGSCDGRSSNLMTITSIFAEDPFDKIKLSLSFWCLGFDFRVYERLWKCRYDEMCTGLWIVMEMQPRKLYLISWISLLILFSPFFFVWFSLFVYGWYRNEWKIMNFCESNHKIKINVGCNHNIHFRLCLLRGKICKLFFLFNFILKNR